MIQAVCVRTDTATRWSSRRLTNHSRARMTLIRSLSTRTIFRSPKQTRWDSGWICCRQRNEYNFKSNCTRFGGMECHSCHKNLGRIWCKILYLPWKSIPSRRLNLGRLSGKEVQTVGRLLSISRILQKPPASLDDLGIDSDSTRHFVE